MKRLTILITSTLLLTATTACEFELTCYNLFDLNKLKSEKSCVGCDLEVADLSNAQLPQADLRKAKLFHAAV